MIVRRRQDSLTHAKLHHIVNTGAPGNRILGYIGIVQAESSKHRRPISVGISIPLSVSGNTLLGFTVLGQYKVVLTFLDTDLGQRNTGYIFRPVSSQVARERCFPNFRRFHICRWVAIASNLVNMLFQAAGIHGFITGIGMGMKRCQIGLFCNADCRFRCFSRCFRCFGCTFRCFGCTFRCFGRLFRFLQTDFIYRCFLGIVSAYYGRFCHAFRRMLMFLITAGCAIGDCNACHA